MLEEFSDNPILSPVPKISSENDVANFFHTLIDQLPITNLTYLGVDIPQCANRQNFFVSTYAADWAERYFEMHYQKIDPIIKCGITTILPFDWKDHESGENSIRNFFGEAREFGVSPKGLSIPIHGARGEKAIFSINSDLPAKDWHHFKRAHIGHLSLLAYHVHIAILDHLMTGETQVFGSLSPREIEVLKWAARGKSSWETGRILGLSAKTIEFYLMNATVKMRAVNKTQAVANASRYYML